MSNTANCPRCKQGNVVEVRIKVNGEIVYLCDECDALWPNSYIILEGNFVDFGLYVNNIGLKGTWDEIEIVNDKGQSSC